MTAPADRRPHQGGGAITMVPAAAEDHRQRMMLGLDGLP